MTNRHITTPLDRPRPRRRLRKVGAKAHLSQETGLPNLAKPDQGADLSPDAFSARAAKRRNADGLPDVLTVVQVATYLQVSRSVVYGEITAGRLPAVRLGIRVIRVSKWALQRWLERRTDE